MIIKGINFGPVWGQSGVMGFFGEGDEYPHHKIYKFLFGKFGFSFKGMTFVAKTTSLYPRLKEKGESNTDLGYGYKLKEWFPNSIWFSVRSILQGYVLNAMGIPTPGLQFLLQTKKWQNRKDIFQISFNPFSKNGDKSIETQIIETKEFCYFLNFRFNPSSYKYGIQVNVSCPNTGGGKQSLIDWIKIAEVFKEDMPNTPLVFKLDLTINQEVANELLNYCDAICMGNTLGFDKLPNKEKFFKGGKSPLEKIFGSSFKGGVSGRPLYPILLDWIKKMEAINPNANIIAGGGIDSKKKILELSKFNCIKAIALGSVAICRPWRVQGLINYGNQIFSLKNNN